MHPQPSPSAGRVADWSPARRIVRVFTAPVERFLQVEAASSIVLMMAAAFALVIANLPLRTAYEAVWSAPFGLSLGPIQFTRDLRWWVNDGLMTIFFFVVGLELRREAHKGELSDLRRAALPLAAALGGMLVPALIYAALNVGTPNLGGWGVPMATDIAFAVGVLALLGKRVPPALRVLLLALAVIDDLGAILVIALFYSSGVHLLPLGLAAAGVIVVLAMQRAGFRRALAYLPPALFIWGATYASGVHPTIAGVVLGLLTPVTPLLGPIAFADAAEDSTRKIRDAVASGVTDLHDDLARVAHASREAVSPVERLEGALHGWVAWLIMPLFAFANAGVPLQGLHLDGAAGRVFAGVVLGLVVGKAVGVFAATRLAAALGLASLPTGVRWGDVTVVGGVAGIGFTMALFIAQLAFPPGPTLEVAKLAILVGSVVAGAVGYGLGRWVLSGAERRGGARSEGEAEASAEV